MGRSLKRRVTVKVNQWLATEHKGAWKVTGPNGAGFTLREEKPEKWKLSYVITTDSRARVQKRSWFHASGLEGAIRKAEETIPGIGPADKDQTIAQVLAWWATNQSCGDGTLALYHNANKYFIAWAGKQGLKRWRELDWDHLQRYANELARAGKSKRTITLYTLSVRSAAKRASAKWRGTFHNFAEGYTPPKNAKGPRRQQAKSLDWVARFLIAQRSQPDGWKVLPGLALQGLCGLRVLEALRLTWDRVDLNRGTVLVDGQVKNEHSIRCLPIPALALAILRETPQEGYRVVSTYAGKDAWLNAVRDAMEDFEAGSYIPPKDFRNTLATERRKRLWNKEVMDLYYGHAATGILDAHYTWLEEEDKRNLFRTEVVEKVDQVLSGHLKTWETAANKVIQWESVRVPNSSKIAV